MSGVGFSAFPPEFGHRADRAAQIELRDIFQQILGLRIGSVAALQTEKRGHVQGLYFVAVQRPRAVSSRCLVGAQIFQGKKCEFETVADAKLVEQLRQVNFHSAFGNPKRPGDFFVAQTLCYQSSHVALAWSQGNPAG